jgi:lipoprotein-anchoring transpeptidase ErfK/SrfK
MRSTSTARRLAALAAAVTVAAGLAATGAPAANATGAPAANAAGARRATAPGARLAATAAVPARFATLAGTSVVRDPPAAIAAPSRTQGATLAGIMGSAQARSRPGAGKRIWRVGTETSWSSEPQVLLVMGSTYVRGREWVRLLLPIRPDGATGWIPRANVVLLHSRYWVIVRRGSRTVTIDRDGRRLRRFRAVVGKAATPTPDGLAAIYERDRQPDPTGFLGPWALPLTILSNVLHNFGGGPGRVAIHGRDGTSLLNPLGSAASHGCIRIDNSPITWMAHHLPQGTPVEIR